jgi:hypothetical protein
MPPAGSELAIPASEQPPTHALDRAASGIVIILPMLHVSNIITRMTIGRSLETLIKAMLFWMLRASDRKENYIILVTQKRQCLTIIK